MALSLLRGRFEAELILPLVNETILIPQHTNNTLQGSQENSTGFGPDSTSFLSTDDAADSDGSWWWAILCGCFLLSFLMFLAFPVEQSPVETHRRRKPKPDPSIRKAAIDEALERQTVLRAEATGSLQLGDAMEADDVGSRLSCSVGSTYEDDNQVACCAICLDPYRVGDTVAWSRHAGESCLHVFHYDCVQEWLAHHDDCPSCRTVIVNAAYDPNKTEDEEDGGESVSSNSIQTEMSAFVIMHGLISRVRRASYNIIGQSVDVHSVDLSDGAFNDEDVAPMTSLSEPSRLRRVLSFGDRMMKRVPRRRSIGWTSLPVEDNDGIFRSTTKLEASFSSQFDDDDGDIENPHIPRLCKPVVLRKVASAGPGSPIRAIRECQSTSSSSTSTTTSNSPFDTIPLQRSSSSFRRRSFRARQESILKRDDLLECVDNDLNLPELRLSRTSVSWAQDILKNGDTDRTEEDDIFIRRAIV